ncbi:MAG: sensor histidine kinase [Haliscomenobacter sp.]|nr:sensor histidine kinase [Haliscomenobacter sp.]
MEGDELHLRNAFRNLIDNALKYCESAPEIHIALEAPTPQQIQLTIRDNGLGIDQQELPGIFRNSNAGAKRPRCLLPGLGSAWPMSKRSWTCTGEQSPSSQNAGKDRVFPLAFR